MLITNSALVDTNYASRRTVFEIDLRHRKQKGIVMAKQKTRFVIRCEGEFRKLFSAMDGRLGDLIVPFTSSSKYIHLDGREEGYIVQKYTFHRSPNADPPAVTLKQTVRLESGKEITSSQLRHRTSDGGFLAYVFGRVCPSLARDKYAVSDSKGQRLVPLHPDDMGTSTLVYHVVVADPDFDERTLKMPGLALTATNFAYFKVIILFGFLRAPAINHGFMSHAATRQMQIDGVAVKQDIPEIDFSSMTVEAVRERVKIGARIFQEEMYPRHLAKMEEVGLTIPHDLVRKRLVETFPNPPARSADGVQA